MSRPAGVLRRVAAAAAGAGTARLVTQQIARQPAVFASWNREHSDGTPVSLTEGLAASVGTLVGVLCAPGRAKVAGALAVVSGAVAGYVDDHLEDHFPAQGKGLKGHLGALRNGQLSSGALKILIIGAGAAASTAILPRSGSTVRRVVQWGSQTILVAGSANLMNLLDLRPGRAVKAGTAASLASVFSTNPVNATLAAGTLGAGLACLPEDLSGQTMLGDMGANAFGAGLGLALAAVKNPVIRWLGVGDVVGLTLLSERYSFTKIIAETPWLDAFDRLGRT